MSKFSAIQLFEACANCALLLLHIIILGYFAHLYNKNSKSPEKPRKAHILSRILITSLIYFGSLCISFIPQIINVLSKSISSDIQILAFSCNYIANLSFAYLVISRFEFTFRKSIYQATRTFVYGSIIIYSVSLSFYTISTITIYHLNEWNVASVQNNMFLIIASVQYYLIDITYFSSVSTAFNSKIFKLILLSATEQIEDKYEGHAASYVPDAGNTKMLKTIAKEINLTSFIILSKLITHAIELLLYTSLIQNSVYIFVLILYYGIIAICIFLSFSVATRFYHALCKYTDQCCLYGVKKRHYGQVRRSLLKRGMYYDIDDSYYNQRNLRISTPHQHYDENKFRQISYGRKRTIYINTDEIETFVAAHCNGIQNCHMVDAICKILNECSSDEDIEKHIVWM